MKKLRKNLIIFISSLIGTNVISCNYDKISSSYGVPPVDYESLPDENYNYDVDTAESNDAETYDCPKYGARPIEFTFSGTVKDTESNPVPDIQITLPVTGMTALTYVETRSKADGTFTIKSPDPSEGVEHFQGNLVIKDIDGAENGGEFIEETYTLQPSVVKEPDQCGFGAVYEEKEIVITLEKKSE